ncbi:geranyl diphosphate 2-C-methyltransferase [Streptomyces boncukensis]|uniref:Methyltransferase domain-containing protein n=1 Tax=Streptomyces boncukensis TaxID=2711219 RepID=A0A6G4WZP7_9ACTN|nr:geranyl diphosphate 2-C-methyltransferase [Streptomyces boncukensis]NGO70769.1 methyltransferase domain-containing protein [Streptomyces boncukensis]
MTAPSTAPSTASAIPYQQDIARYWNEEERPVNLRLGAVDGLYHHHYGIGEVDWSVLDAPEPDRDQSVINELHRLETAQSALLLDALGDIRPGDRVLDAGCGRGGTSVLAHDRFGCSVDGITLSSKQAEFAAGQAKQRGIDEHVAFHTGNMLDTGFTPGGYRAVWNNESTMYVDLTDLFAAHSRLLARGGRYVTITGCYNEVYGQPSKAVSTINAHYECNIHGRNEYFRALAANRLVPIEVRDLTPETIPYWELRARSSVATGIEEAFLSSYRDRSFQYLLIAADRV